MRSGELARLVGVSIDTLRHYEKKGLLARPPRGANGYRIYPLEAIARTRLIQRALDMGFSLDDLARVLHERDAGGAPCHRVRDIAVKRLQELEARILELRSLHRELRALVDGWDARLRALPPGVRAGLLDALASTRARTSYPRLFPRRRS